jgi:predicted HicB family RNase H-like nuclease
MSEPTKRGRPPLTPGDVPARIDIRVSSTQYDQAYQRAQREGISVPALVRRSLTRELADPDDDE